MGKFLGINFGSNKRTKVVVSTTPVKADPEPVKHERSGPQYTIPEKVYIERDGPYGSFYTFNERMIDELLYGPYGQQNLMTLFYCLPELASAVDQIARRVADACWQLKTEKDDELDEKSYIYQKFNQLFEQPNPLQTGRQHMYAACCYYLLTGKNFFFINSGVLDPTFDYAVTWSNLPATETVAHIKRGVDFFTITQISDIIEKYTVPQNGGTREFYPKHIVPILNLSLINPRDLNAPVSIFKGAEKAISNLIAVYEARGHIYINRGPLGLLVNRKTDPSGTDALLPDEKKEINDELTQSYGVQRGKNSIAIMPVPMEFVPVGANIKDMMPFEETEADCVALFATASIPRHLAPTQSASTFANGDTDMKDFYNGVIIPIAKMFAQALTTGFRLGVDKDIRNRRYIYADYSHVPFLQDDRQKRATTDQANGNVYMIRFYNGVGTLNEWIVSNGGNIKSDPIYNKTLLEMTPEEQDRIKQMITLKSQITQTSSSNDSTGNTQASSGKAA